MPARTFDLIKAKQRRQKQIAIGGAALLLLLLVVEGPKIFKQLHGGSSTPAWLAASRSQTATGGTAAVSAPATGTPSTAVPGGTTAPAATGSAGGSVLVSDQPPTAGPGQLSSFGTFSSKDPFAAQVNLNAGTSPAVGGSNGSTGAASPPPTVALPAPAAPSGSRAAAQTVTSVVISVNGILGSVAVGTDFPAVSPMFPVPLFHLVSATQHTAKISIAGGSYASGAATVTLTEGKPVTLQNTADGTRYTLKLLPQGTTVPTTQSGTTSAPATTTTQTQQAPTGPIVTTPLIPTTSLTP